MHRNILLATLALVALGGCAVKAPTNSSQQASTSQKNAVLALAAACQTFDHAQQMIATAIANGHQFSPSDVQRIRTVQTAIVPLCTTFPANSAAAITQITISATTLTGLLPTNAPASSTGGQK